MSTRWHVKRTTIARHDGQRRWDYAYQFLLQWVFASEAGPMVARSDQQEDAHERGRICAHLDQSSTANPND
jgi:hypothetical protein